MAIRRFDQTINPSEPSLSLVQAALSSPFEGLMTAVEGFANRQAIQVGQQAAFSDVMAGKNPTPSAGMTVAGQAYNEAAQKAYEARTSNDLRSKVTEITNQYSGLKVGDANAADQLMRAHIEGLTQNIPEQFRASVLTEAEARRADMYSRISSSEKQNQFQRDLSEIKSGIDGFLEEAQMRARDGAAPDVLAGIDAKVTSNYARLVELGQFNDQEAKDQIKEYSDKVNAEKIIGNALRSGNIVGTMDSAISGQGTFKDMPLKLRSYVTSQLGQEYSRQRALAQRTTTENDKIARSFVETLSNGQGLNNQENARKDAMISGVIPLSAEVHKDLTVAENVSYGMAQLVSMGPDDAGKMFQSVLAAVPDTPIGREVQSKLREKFSDHVAKVRGDDGLAYVEKIGGLSTIAGTPALDTTSLDSFAASFTQRKNAIDTARMQYRTNFPYLTKQDAESVGTMFGTLNQDQKVAFFGQLSQTIGDSNKYREALDLVWKNKSSPYVKAGNIALTDPNLAKEIVYGQAMIDTKAVSIDPSRVTGANAGSNLTSTAIALMQSSPDGKELESIRSASTAIYAARYPGLTGSSFDSSKFDSVVKEVAGETHYVGFNNAPQLLPRGWSAGQWDDAIRNVSDEEIIQMGGTREIAYMLRRANVGYGGALGSYTPSARKQLTGFENPPELSGQALAFSRIEDGKYAIHDGAVPVLDSRGMPFILDTSVIKMKPTAFSEMMQSLTGAIAAIPPAPANWQAGMR